MRIAKVLSYCLSAWMTCTIILVGNPCRSQQIPKPAPVDSLKVYQEVLENIFPPPDRNLDGVCHFVLKFAPTRHPESELIILVRRDGTGRATLYSVAEPSAFTIVDDYISSTGNGDVNEIAKLIHLKKLVTVIPASQMASMRSELNKGIADTVDKLRRDAATVQGGGSYTMVIDGTIYDLAFEQAGSTLRWHFDDLEVEDPDNTFLWPLVRWMNHLRTYMLGQATDK